MRVDIVSVFTQHDPLIGGNPLAVVSDASSLSPERMQALARTLNFSESTFVTEAGVDTYDVRIFTPNEELPFAGHPTLGTAWVLRDLGIVTADSIIQRSGVGETPIEIRDGGGLCFARMGDVEDDVHDVDEVAAALGLPVEAVGLERAGRMLRPASASAGISQLMVPLKDLAALGAVTPDRSRLGRLSPVGAYCFTASGPDELRARGFFPAVGVMEDAATGSAAAGLGLYLADRLGHCSVDVHQGVEMGRPSVISLDAQAGRVEVGGNAARILSGDLEI